MKNKLIEQLSFLGVCFCIVMFTGCTPSKEDIKRKQLEQEEISRKNTNNIERFTVKKLDSFNGASILLFKDNNTDKEYLYYEKTMTELKPKEPKEPNEVKGE